MMMKSSLKTTNITKNLPQTLSTGDYRENLATQRLIQPAEIKKVIHFRVDCVKEALADVVTAGQMEGGDCFVVPLDLDCKEEKKLSDERKEMTKVTRLSLEFKKE